MVVHGRQLADAVKTWNCGYGFREQPAFLTIVASISGIDYEPSEAAWGIADSPNVKLEIALFQNFPKSIVMDAEALLCHPALDPHPFG